MLVSTVLALAFAHAARAQTSTVSLMPLLPGDGMQGQVVGTGSDGTTYRLVGTFPSLSIPFTATLVQDATHASEVVVLETSGVSLVVHGECDFASDGSGQAECVQTIIEPSSTSALSLTGPVSFTGVPIVAGSAPLGTPSHSQIGGSGSGTQSTLPPSISVSSSGTGAGATATLATSSAAASPTESNAARSTRASRNVVVVLGLALPAVSWLLA